MVFELKFKKSVKQLLLAFSSFRYIFFFCLLLKWIRNNSKPRINHLHLAMPSKFYASIIAENEKEIENSALKKACKDMSRHYGTSSMKKYLNYNNAAYRCAYLYKYAALYTGMATKYFRKMFQKKEAKTILNFNKNIKICCLGGGPGAEVVGIFKAIAIKPHLHKRVTKVSLLNMCQGWETTFNSILSNLITGKEDQVPDTFIDQHKFKNEFIQVDLQDFLSDKVRKVISDADVICMMKFVSVLPIERSLCVLKVLGELFKKKALILFIDDFKVNASVDYFSRLADFKVVLGPLEDEKYIRHSSSNEKMYGCKPHMYANISVIGWIKLSQRNNYVYDTSLSVSYSSLTDNGTIGMESAIKDLDIFSNSDEEWEVATVCDKYTQTEQDYFSNTIESEMVPSAVQVELADLMQALADLLTLIEKFTLKKKVQKTTYCHAFRNCH